MKVYLLHNVKGLGEKGEIKEVTDGYGRNFLVPKKLVKEVDAAVLSEKKSKDEAFKYKLQQEILEAQKIVSFLKGKMVVVKVKLGVGGKFFGKVTSKEVAQAIKDAFDVKIDRKKIVLPEIKQLGIFEFKVKVYAKKVARMKVSVEES